MTEDNKSIVRSSSPSLPYCRGGRAVHCHCAPVHFLTHRPATVALLSTFRPYDPCRRSNPQARADGAGLGRRVESLSSGSGVENLYGRSGTLEGHLRYLPCRFDETQGPSTGGFDETVGALQEDHRAGRGGDHSFAGATRDSSASTRLKVSHSRLSSPRRAAAKSSSVN